eukprot:jgi/Undpi1/12331/HiC_scaffold_5.g02007.m1
MLPADASAYFSGRCLLYRHLGGTCVADSVWSSAEVSTAIGRDLVGKAERWKLLAGEPMTGSSPRAANGHLSLLPEVDPHASHGVDKHELASYYVKDALAGRESPVCVLDQKSLEALKLVRNKAWNHMLNVCTIIHLILPMIEIQRCLPCMGMQKVPYAEDPDLLRIGWRPTQLGSMWLECALCLLYSYDLYQVRLSRWSRVTLPFLFISRRTYLKHFVGGMIRVLPRMTPVFFLMSFVGFFYAFLGYVIFREEPRDEGFLADLPLFEEPGSAALTFLRMFMSIPFMLDTEQKYGGRKGIQVMGLSYGVIMVIFMGALVPAVANRNFQYQSKESYNWVKEQRKLALTRAYLLLRQPGGTVGREDWIHLMSFLRPDCDREHTSALFEAAYKADTHANPQHITDHSSGGGGGGGGDRNKVSKEGFFMLCALGKAKFSQHKEDGMLSSGSSRSIGGNFGTLARPPGLWTRIRKKLRKGMAWSLPGSTFPLSLFVFNLSLLLQGYQIVREGDDPEGRPDWAYPLGRNLIIFFCLFSAVRMAALGPVAYLKHWRHVLGLWLNLVGVAYYMGLWFSGEGWHSLYVILQASRLGVLWDVLHRLGPTTSEVATRLEFVFPAVLRASFVLFSVTYSYSVVAFAMYCDTPLGMEPADGVKDHSMMQRWENYKDVISFGSLLQSFAAMTDVIMLSNWPIFMDAAGDVGNWYISTVFFYSFKGLTFYFVMPLPGSEATKAPALGSSSKVIPRVFFSIVYLFLRTNVSGSGGGRGDTQLGSTSSARRFSAVSDGMEEDVDVDKNEGSDYDDSSDEDDASEPVVITSHSRSISQAFWGAEQAKDNEGGLETSTMQGTISRLETENASLRGLVDSMQMDLQVANARLYEELQIYPQREPSPRRAQRRALGIDTSTIGTFTLPESAPLRHRVGSANSIGGMEAIVETEDEEVGHL